MAFTHRLLYADMIPSMERISISSLLARLPRSTVSAPSDKIAGHSKSLGSIIP